MSVCVCECVCVFVCVCVCEHVCVFVILKAGEYLPGFDEMRQEASRCPVLAVLQLQLRAGLISDKQADLHGTVTFRFSKPWNLWKHLRKKLTFTFSSGQTLVSGDSCERLGR